MSECRLGLGFQPDLRGQTWSETSERCQDVHSRCPVVPTGSENQDELAMLSELDSVVELVKDMKGWEDFVHTLEGNPLILEIISEFDFQLSREQLAAFMFWRLTSMTVAEDGLFENEFDDEISEEDEDANGLMLFSLRVWKEQVLTGELLHSDEFITFETLASMLQNYAPRSQEESEAIMAEFETQISETNLKDAIQPLPDSEVDSILRRRRGQGLSDFHD